MKATQLVDEYDVIEQAMHRLIWTEQKRFTQLLEEHKLSLPRFLVLWSIKRRGVGCPIGTLADEWLQSYPTMTDIVDRLEENKLVTRERVDPKDRRKVMVSLTPQGHQLLARAHTARRERMTQALANFTAEDRREFLRLLSNYMQALEKDPE
jgi:DNA-binding MarR family transcriptional regulator